MTDSRRIQFRCFECGRGVSSPAHGAGKRARCPVCDTVVTVPIVPLVEADRAIASRCDNAATREPEMMAEPKPLLEWKIITGHEATEAAIERNVILRSVRFDAVALVPATQPHPDKFHARGSVQCHVCGGVVEFRRDFFTAGLSDARMVCPKCEYQVGLMTSAEGELIFLVATPGTEPLEGTSRKVSLQVDQVDGRPPVAYQVPISQERIDSLIKQLDDPVGGRDGIAKGQLLEIGEPAMHELIRVVSGEARICGRDKAASVLAKMGRPAIGPLHDVLMGGCPEATQSAAKALMWAGELGTSALIAALRSHHPETRYAAAEYLGYGDIPKRLSERNTWSLAISRLIECLSDENSKVQSEAASSLGSIARKGGDCSAALPILLERLQEGAHWAARPLCEFGPDAASVTVPALLRAVEAGNGIAHWELIHHAHYVGSPALPALVKGLAHPSRGVRHPASAAICDILEENSADIPQYLIPALITALRDDDDDSIRFFSALALKMIGPRAKTAVPALRKRLCDGDKWVADVAYDALAAIDPKASRQPPLVTSIISWCRRLASSKK